MQVGYKNFAIFDWVLVGKIADRRPTLFKRRDFD